MRRRLLIVTAASLVGYGIGWNAHAFGWTPVLLLALVSAVSWLAGAVWTASRSVLPLTLAVTEAHQERDLLEQERDNALARIAQLEDGGSYVARSVLAHPSVRAKVYPQQRQGR